MVIQDLWQSVMSRIIFSFYIDIPKDKLVSHHESKDLFNDHYDWLLKKQQDYATSIGVDYKHFVYDEKYVSFENNFVDNHSEISHYNIVNFYKIHLMYEMAKEYDEILYLDFDVIPITKKNFFEKFNLSKGAAIMTGTAPSQRPVRERDILLDFKHSVRSPMAKYWNTMCMLSEVGYSLKSEVFNTGIVGVTSDYLKQLDYFGDFEQTIQLMSEMCKDDFYPDNIRYMFGYDNETIWGYKTIVKELAWQELGNDWHFFMDKWSYVSRTSEFIHCVSKDFNHVRQWCEKNNL